LAGAKNICYKRSYYRISSYEEILRYKSQKRYIMKPRILLLLAIVFNCLSACNKENAYYIAPDGNDKNPGTKSKPFKTIQAARDAVRTLKNDDHFSKAINLCF